MKRGEFFKSVVLGLGVVLVFGAAMFALNFHTGPLIEQNNAGAKFGPLLAVMPEGARFDGDALLYSADDPTASTLRDVPGTVTAIYRESTGLGYAVKLAVTSSYSKAPMEISLGVGADGKICSVQVDSYNDTESYDFRAKDPGYLASYAGKDSALADVGLVAGTTFSSTAFKNGVADGLSALISNGLIAEGVKGDDQLLTELIPTVFPGMAMDGIVKAESLECSGSMVSALKAQNGAGFAYVMRDGESMVLAVVNASGVCTVYDTAGADVTAAHPAVADEARAHAAANQVSYADAAVKKFEKMLDGAQLEPVEIPTYGTLVAAYKATVGEERFLALYSRSYGYDDMDVYVVIDQAGAIHAVDAKTVFFDAEYFPVSKTVDTAAYKSGFAGLTESTWNGEAAVISGATMTSNAMKQSLSDAFAAFAALN